MKLAGEQADPYWKEKINIVKSEMTRSLTSLNEDYASTESDLMRRKNEIDADLIYNKDQLSTEQASELARQKDNIDLQLEDTRAQMASRGLTSSSISNRARERLQKENNIVTGSIQRKYADLNRTNELGSVRKVADITSQIDDLKRKFGESKTDVVRKAEGYLGSGELAGIEGLAGNTTGTLLEDKANDVLTRATSLMASDYGVK